MKRCGVGRWASGVKSCTLLFNSTHCSTLNAQRRAKRGFTLVEVMVALAITAIALVAGLKATAALNENAGRQDALLLAQLCADNQLIALRLARQLPGVGDSTNACEQAGRSFQVALRVRPTPNPNFRRVEATVIEQGLTVLHVSTIAGRN